jgi:hypothetical protein
VIYSTKPDAPVTLFGGDIYGSRMKTSDGYRVGSWFDCQLFSRSALDSEKHFSYVTRQVQPSHCQLSRLDLWSGPRTSGNGDPGYITGLSRMRLLCMGFPHVDRARQLDSRETGWGGCSLVRAGRLISTKRAAWRVSMLSFTHCCLCRMWNRLVSVSWRAQSSRTPDYGM